MIEATELWILELLLDKKHYNEIVLAVGGNIHDHELDKTLNDLEKLGYINSFEDSSWKITNEGIIVYKKSWNHSQVNKWKVFYSGVTIGILIGYFFCMITG